MTVTAPPRPSDPVTHGEFDALVDALIVEARQRQRRRRLRNGAIVAVVAIVGSDGGKKVISGGFASDGDVISFGSRPIGDSTWGIHLWNIADGNAGVTLYAVCVG